MKGRAYFRSPRVELYIEGDVVTSLAEVERRGPYAVGLLPFHAVSPFDSAEARRREPWPEALFVVGQPSAPSLRGGGISLRLEEEVPCGEYEEAVEEAKRALARGELFQLVLSRFKKFKGWATPDAVLKRLAAVMDGKYYFFLEAGDLWVAGISPETLVSVEEGRAWSSPIGGTRPRGVTSEEDLALEAELVNSVKDRAEHIMLVDSVRNDLGRVCAWGTVSASRVAVVEKFSYVQHLVSYVGCRLARGVTPLRAAAALNPTTTVTGVPKPRAIEYIDALEREPRGPFAGSFGAVWPESGDFAVVIRSLYGEGDTVYLWGGAGIVMDSDPKGECRETEVKMGPIARALTSP
mgnify:CR=1 FL=1